MELLGNKNKQKNLLTQISEINQKFLTSSSLTEEELKNILTLLDTLINSNDNALLCSCEVFSMLFLFFDTPYEKNLPIFHNLIMELKLKLLRLCRLPSVTNTNSFETGLLNNSDSFLDCNERERFLPTSTNNFILPPPGEITNLTVTTPNSHTGKSLVRELIINHEGYVISEQSRRYEDMYTDESEKIYNDAYLKELRSLNEND